ncbi:MAG: hypothetical protein KJ626_16105 [Verrucomicrobia bacterium]|nr:hypothetical protein [Verrucomicrobiota bacterium]
MTKTKANVLDCTIRDGSYLIKYQFTAEDTFFVASSLCRAGIGRIEVGHGLGLDAQYKGKGAAAISDAEYIEAGVAAAGDKAKIGVFFIPSFASLDSIRAAADVGLGFIRVGTNINQYELGKEAIELAKSLGLEVWANLMKSYVMTPVEFAGIAKSVADYGADIVALVDSAGGMTPTQVREYARAALDIVDVPLGFHGHNNLDLVIANCLAFIEEGGLFVDGTLRGMGRSAGNAATELLCALLDREGYDIGDVDWEELIALGQRLIEPNVPRDIGLLPDEIASGLQYFHSSFQPLVDKSSAAAGVEPYRTILRLGVESRKLVTEEMAAQAAREAALSGPEGQVRTKKADYKWLHREACESLEDLLAELKVVSPKTGYEPVMTLARTRSADHHLRIAPVRVGSGYCVGHVEVPAGRETEIYEMFKGEVRLWMADRDIEKPATLEEGTLWLKYDDDMLLLTGLRDAVEILGCGGSIYMPECNESFANLVRTIIGDCDDSDAEIGVAISPVSPFNEEDVGRIKLGGKLLLSQPNAISQSAVEHARKRGLQIWRLDLGEALLAEVARLFQSAKRLQGHAGRVEVSGLGVVAGGVVGEGGDYIVNSVMTPTTIIGKADGRGGVLPLSAADDEAKSLIIDWILNSMGSSR